MTTETLNPNLGQEQVAARPPEAPTPEEVSEQFRVVELGGAMCETNLPDGVMPLSNSDIDSGLDPAKLDELPVGDFEINTEVIGFDSGEVEKVTRPINVLMGAKGRTISIESFGKRRKWDAEVQSGTKGLMELLGYGIEDRSGKDTIVSVPTPETLKSATGLVGVELEFFPDDKYIPGDKYLGAYADGKYPISTSDIGMYEHDICDDHITATVLGGDVLRDALRDVAGSTLAASDPELVDKIAGGIDEFTVTLRGVVSRHDQIGGSAYGYANGRATLREAGAAIGISEEDVDNILKTAQVLGIKIIELA